jgi:hypothetical protein
LLDWLRVEYAIEKPSNKLLAVAGLDSDTWVSEVKRIRGKRQPLIAEPSALRFLLSTLRSTATEDGSALPISAFPHALSRPPTTSPRP